MGSVDLLLQEIQKAAGCLYLSDLHSPNTTFDQWAEKLIFEIPDSRYTLEKWNKAASYILETPCNFQSIGEAKNRISRRI